jgi:hypothetical protein
LPAGLARPFGGARGGHPQSRGEQGLKGGDLSLVDYVDPTRSPADANFFMTKPFNLTTLKGVITQLMRPPQS